MSDYRTNKGDVFKDPITGIEYEAAAVLRAEDLGRFTDNRSFYGSSGERCALHGAPAPKEMRRKDLPRPCPARDGRLKESA